MNNICACSIKLASKSSISLSKTWYMKNSVIIVFDDNATTRSHRETLEGLEGCSEKKKKKKRRGIIVLEVTSVSNN